MAGDVVVPESRRATIGFIPRAAADLDLLVQGTGLRQTDVVNRAVQVYALIERELAKGKKLAFIAPDGSVEGISIV